MTPEIDALLRRFVDDLRGALGASLIGLYVHGSLVFGDFDPERSDVDLLAALLGDVDESTLKRLRDVHAHLVADFPSWHHRVEVDYLSLSAMRAVGEGSTTATMARISPGEPLHLIPATEHYLINWFMARRGVALFGPPPHEVVPAVSQAAFLRVVVAHARAWPEWVKNMRRPGGQAYAVLSLCRALYAVTHGAQVSKKQAARFARNELTTWAELIDWAVALRYEGREETDGRDRLGEVSRFVRDVSDRVVNFPEVPHHLPENEPR